MNKRSIKRASIRLLSIIMCAAVAFGFIPFMNYSYAEDSAATGETRAFEVMDDGSEVEVDMSQYYPQIADPNSIADEILIDDGAEAGNDEALPEPVREDPSVRDADCGNAGSTATAEIGSIYKELSDSGIFGKMPSGIGIQETSIEEVPSDSYNIQSTRNGNIVTYTGYINAPYRLGALYFDGPNGKLANINSNTINYSIDLSNVAVGYHTVILEVFNQNTGSFVDYIGDTYIAVNPTDKPDDKGSIEAYSTYIKFWPYSFGSNSKARLYMEYKPASSTTWNRSGYMESNMIVSYYNQVYKISGFKKNKKYNTRIRYGVNAEYNLDEQTYTFYGPTLSTGTFKTGQAKKPAIKKVRAKAVSVKYHKIRHYGPYTGVYLYTEKFYTCKVKVIVKLKKKPGTKGIVVNGRYLKGNKKTYSTTFNPYPNYHQKHPRGRSKFKVTLRSYQSKKYGGYSPTYSKTKKLS